MIKSVVQKTHGSVSQSVTVIIKYYVVHTTVQVVLSQNWQHSRFVYTSIAISMSVTPCTKTLQQLQPHLAMGIFQLLQNLTGPPSYTWPVFDRNVIMWLMTIQCSSVSLADLYLFTKGRKHVSPLSPYMTILHKMAGGSQAFLGPPKDARSRIPQIPQGFSNLARVPSWKFHALLFQHKEKTSRKETEKAHFLPSCRGK